LFQKFLATGEKYSAERMSRMKQRRLSVPCLSPESVVTKCLILAGLLTCSIV